MLLHTDVGMKTIPVVDPWVGSGMSIMIWVLLEAIPLEKNMGSAAWLDAGEDGMVTPKVGVYVDTHLC